MTVTYITSRSELESELGVLERDLNFSSNMQKLEPLPCSLRPLGDESACVRPYNYFIWELVFSALPCRASRGVR